MKLNDTINTEITLNNIESMLLDFEQFPQTAVLYSILAELDTLSKKLRRFFQLKNINGLINELIIAVSAAIEREIVLEVKNIDLFLHIISLISNSCNINYVNIEEISTITNEISTEYVNNIKNITRTIPLLKKTKYLKNDLLKEYESIKEENKIIKTENNNVTTENKNIKTEINNKTIPTQEIKLTNLAELVDLFNKTINIAQNNAIPLTDNEKNNIINIENYIKEHPINDTTTELNASDKQIDAIDNYIATIKQFADSNKTENISNKTENISNKTENISNKTENDSIKTENDSIKTENDSNKTENDSITPNETILTKQIKYNEIEKLIENAISLNEIVNYNEFIRTNINKITKNISNIENFQNKIEKNESNIENFQNKIEKNESKTENINNITQNLNEIKATFNNLNEKINEKLLNAAVYTNAIYSQISKIRTKTFNYFTIGLNEFANIIANTINKKVNMTIKGKNTEIFANLWDIFNNILPNIIRNIILNSTNDNININIETKTQFGTLELIISDNNKPININKIGNIMKEPFKICKKAEARIFISNNSQGNKIKIKFQITNYMNNYMIIESNKQLYAILTEYFTNLTPNFDNLTEKFTNLKEINLNEILKNESKIEKSSVKTEKNESKIEKISNKTEKNENKIEKNHVLVQFEDRIIKIFVDKIISIALLSPKNQINSSDFLNNSPDFLNNSPDFLNNSPDFLNNSPDFLNNSSDFLNNSSDFLNNSSKNAKYIAGITTFADKNVLILDIEAIITDNFPLLIPLFPI